MQATIIIQTHRRIVLIINRVRDDYDHKKAVSQSQEASSPDPQAGFGDERPKEGMGKGLGRGGRETEGREGMRKGGERLRNGGKEKTGGRDSIPELFPNSRSSLI